MEYRTDDAALLELWTAARFLGEVRKLKDPVAQGEFLTQAEILLIGFITGLEPVFSGQTGSAAVETSAGAARKF